MSFDDRQRWERRHAEARALSPRASVLALPPASPAGALALDLACGQGRHALALARAGYSVVAMDVSRSALGHLRAAAPDHLRGDVLALQADTDHWPLADESFDLVVQVDFLDRRLFPSLRDSLRRGGLLLIDTFLDQGRPNAEGPSRREFLLEAGELPRAFADFDVVRYAEERGDTARAVLLARKR